MSSSSVETTTTEQKSLKKKRSPRSFFRRRLKKSQDVPSIVEVAACIEYDKVLISSKLASGDPAANVKDQIATRSQTRNTKSFSKRIFGLRRAKRMSQKCKQEPVKKTEPGNHPVKEVTPEEKPTARRGGFSFWLWLKWLLGFLPVRRLVNNRETKKEKESSETMAESEKSIQHAIDHELAHSLEKSIQHERDHELALKLMREEYESADIHESDCLLEVQMEDDLRYIERCNCIEELNMIIYECQHCSPELFAAARERKWKLERQMEDELWYIERCNCIEELDEIIDKYRHRSHELVAAALKRKSKLEYSTRPPHRSAPLQELIRYVEDCDSIRELTEIIEGGQHSNPVLRAAAKKRRETLRWLEPGTIPSLGGATVRRSGIITTSEILSPEPEIAVLKSFRTRHSNPVFRAASQNRRETLQWLEPGTIPSLGGATVRRSGIITTNEILSPEPEIAGLKSFRTRHSNPVLRPASQNRRETLQWLEPGTIPSLGGATVRRSGIITTSEILSPEPEIAVLKNFSTR